MLFGGDEFQCPRTTGMEWMGIVQTGASITYLYLAIRYRGRRCREHVDFGTSLYQHLPSADKTARPKQSSPSLSLTLFPSE